MMQEMPDIEWIRAQARRQAMEQRQRLMEQTGRDRVAVEHALWLHDDDEEKAKDYLMRRVRGLFPLGRVLITPGAADVLTEAAVAPHALLERHVAGDWGEEIDQHDTAVNEAALKTGARLLSAYRVSGKAAPEKVWLITEADRSATTILLPDEY